jgi:hypothetical protein
VAGFNKGKSAICGYVGSPTLLTTYRVAKLGIGPAAHACLRSKRRQGLKFTPRPDRGTLSIDPVWRIVNATTGLLGGSHHH